MQHDEQMVKHVRALSDRPLAVLGNSGEHGFDRLFAEFLGALGNAAVEQFSGVGFLRVGGGGAVLQLDFRGVYRVAGDGEQSLEIGL